jgi:hypothetical protein
MAKTEYYVILSSVLCVCLRYTTIKRKKKNRAVIGVCLSSPKLMLEFNCSIDRFVEAGEDFRGIG